MNMEKIKSKVCTYPAPHPKVCQSYTFLFKDKPENSIKAGAVDAGFHIKGLPKGRSRISQMERGATPELGDIKPFGKIVGKTARKWKNLVLEGTHAPTTPSLSLDPPVMKPIWPDAPFPCWWSTGVNVFRRKSINVMATI